MNFRDFILSNPEIENNIKAVVRGSIAIKKMTSNKEIELLKQKMEINMDRINNHMKKMRYSNDDIKELYDNIQYMSELLQLNYNNSIGFKNNYSKAVRELEEYKERINSLNADNSEKLNDEQNQDNEDNKELDENNTNDNEKESDDNNNNINNDIEDNNSNNIESENSDFNDIEYDEENNSDRVRIVYNDSGYYISDVEKSIPINTKLLENGKEKEVIEEELLSANGNGDYDKIFEDFKKRRAQRKIKNYDPNLLKIIYNKFGVEIAKLYLNELSKGKDADPSNLPFDLVYDLDSLKKNSDIDKKTLKKQLKIAKKSKHIAQLINGRNKKKLLAKGTLGVLGAAITVGTVGAVASHVGEKDQNIKNNNTISDVENNKDNTYNNENTKPDGPESEDEWRKNLQDSANIEDQNKTETSLEKLYQQLEGFELGKKVYLNEGINYYEDSLKSKNADSGTIGKVQWRPAGDYIVEGVSIVNPKTNEIINYSFGEEENFKLLDYLKSNMQKEFVVRFHIDKDGTKPTGWVDSKEIINALNKEKNVQKGKLSVDGKEVVYEIDSL